MIKINKPKQELGQALLESLITYIILFFCVFAVIEVARLLAFKSYLQALVSDISQQISHSHLALKRDGVIPKESGIHTVLNKKFKEKIEENLNKKIKLFQTSNFSFDRRKKGYQEQILFLEKHSIGVFITFVNSGSHVLLEQKPAGVYMKVNFCLPVLFSGFFKNFMHNKKNLPEIGKSVNEKNLEDESTRNCLGYYSNSKYLSPLFWFRVRAASYFPWPASSSIYEFGFPIPKNIIGLEKENRDDALKALNELDLSKFFVIPAKESFL